MARKRMRRRRDPNTPGSAGQVEQGHAMQPTMIDGKMVHIRQIRTTDEGVLYTHAISVSSSIVCCDWGCLADSWDLLFLFLSLFNQFYFSLSWYLTFSISASLKWLPMTHINDTILRSGPVTSRAAASYNPSTILSAPPQLPAMTNNHPPPQKMTTGNDHQPHPPQPHCKAINPPFSTTNPPSILPNSTPLHPRRDSSHDS